MQVQVHCLPFFLVLYGYSVINEPIRFSPLLSRQYESSQRLQLQAREDAIFQFLAFFLSHQIINLPDHFSTVRSEILPRKPSQHHV